jgi:hypothetical protein
MTITYLVFTSVLTLLISKNSLSKVKSRVNKKSKWIIKEIIIIAFIYFIIYNVFGYFVAWQFEETRLFYTGSSELKSFFETLIINILDYNFVGIHLFRGLLFGIAGYCVNHAISGTRIKKIIIISLIFGGFGVQIIMPNPFFPEIVRISHFIETTSSMILFGVIIGYILTTPYLREFIEKYDAK